MMKFIIIQKILAANSDIKIPEGPKSPADPSKVDWTQANIGTVLKYVDTATGIALDIAIIIGIIMVFYSAFLYVSSFGDDAKAGTAKKTLIWAAIGTAVVIASKLIVNTLGNFLSVS